MVMSNKTHSLWGVKHTDTHTHTHVQQNKRIQKTFSKLVIILYYWNSKGLCYLKTLLVPWASFPPPQDWHRPQRKQTSTVCVPGSNPCWPRRSDLPADPGAARDKTPDRGSRKWMNTTYKVPFVLMNKIQGRMMTLHFCVGVCRVRSNTGQLSPAHHGRPAQPAGRVTTSLLKVGDPWMFRDMRSCLSLLDLNHLALFYNMLN